MRYDRRVAVSDREREHMRRLGEYKSQGHGAATAAHLALSREDRLARSVALMRRFFSLPRQRQDDPTPLFDRARRLGLYRP